uniref:Aminopeptidase N n=1 Tax=Sipha flava TaxID=143950 RepID=A0A2S2QD74_9HEMI
MLSLRMEFRGYVEMRFAVALFLVLGAAFARSQEVPEYRLPTTFKPISYRLDVTTHLENKFTFEGVVDIKITCLKATNTVVLHSNNLNIDTKGVAVSDGGGKVVPVTGVGFVTKTELMHVKCAEKFKPGNEYVLTVPFMGNITDDLVGYYRSSYVDKETNQTRWLAVTQFEPADARRAFPCFDEPALKATFKIRLGRRKHLTSVSNMRLLKSTPMPSNPDYVIDEFEESVPMSTYLVAYMVSDFAYVESKNPEEEVKFRIVARKDAIGQTELAKNAGPLVLKYYEDYFDEKFPLSKQDMVAIPDFSAGAMENWGLVTYRETALLIDPNVATIDNIHRVAEVIAHELAHQWFGNLVTMKWWTDLWLNEGFATYVAARGVDYVSLIVIGYS